MTGYLRLGRRRKHRSAQAIEASSKAPASSSARMVVIDKSAAIGKSESFPRVVSADEFVTCSRCGGPVRVKGKHRYGWIELDDHECPALDPPGSALDNFLTDELRKGAA